MLCFYTAVSTVLGLFTPASPQTGQQYVVLGHYDLTIGIFQLHDNVMGPLLYVQPIVDRNVVTQRMTVVSNYKHFWDLLYRETHFFHKKWNDFSQVNCVTSQPPGKC